MQHDQVEKHVAEVIHRRAEAAAIRELGEGWGRQCQ